MKRSVNAIILCVIQIRAQASVLRKGILEEQSKNSNLRDQLKQKELEARRSEQEIDSLGFRNKQLELRVAALQEELATSEARKRDKDKKRSPHDKNDAAHNNAMANKADISQDALIFEELQKKIIENAELTSLVCILRNELLFIYLSCTNLHLD